MNDERMMNVDYDQICLTMMINKKYHFILLIVY